MFETVINWKFLNKMPSCLIALLLAHSNHCLFWHRSSIWFLLAFYLIHHWYIFLISTQTCHGCDNMKNLHWGCIIDSALYLDFWILEVSFGKKKKNHIALLTSESQYNVTVNGSSVKHNYFQYSKLLQIFFWIINSTTRCSSKEKVVSSWWIACVTVDNVEEK